MITFVIIEDGYVVFNRTELLTILKLVVHGYKYSIKIYTVSRYVFNKRIKPILFKQIIDKVPIGIDFTRIDMKINKIDIKELKKYNSIKPIRLKLESETFKNTIKTLDSENIFKGQNIEYYNSLISFGSYLNSIEYHHNRIEFFDTIDNIDRNFLSDLMKNLNIIKLRYMINIRMYIDIHDDGKIELIKEGMY